MKRMWLLAGVGVLYATAAMAGGAVTTTTTTVTTTTVSPPGAFGPILGIGHGVGIGPMTSIPGLANLPIPSDSSLKPVSPGVIFFAPPLLTTATSIGTISTVFPSRVVTVTPLPITVPSGVSLSPVPVVVPSGLSLSPAPITVGTGSVR